MRRKPDDIDPVEYLRFTRRVVRAAGQRASLADPEQLAELVAISKEIDEAMTKAVRGLRTSGATWQEIGEATGTSRQAAHQKWALL